MYTVLCKMLLYMSILAAVSAARLHHCGEYVIKGKDGVSEPKMMCQRGEPDENGCVEWVDLNDDSANNIMCPVKKAVPPPPIEEEDVETEASAMVDPVNWKRVEALIARLQADLAKKDLENMRADADDLERAISKESNAFVAYDYKNEEIKAGVSPRIVRDNSIVARTSHLWRRPSSTLKLHTEMNGQGSVYTGRDFKRKNQALKQGSWDPRYASGGGSEIWTKDRTVRFSKDFNYNAPSSAHEIVERDEGFHHSSTGDVDLIQAAKSKTVHLILADMVKENDTNYERLAVRAIYEGKPSGWRLLAGDPKDCSHCFTGQVAEFVGKVGLKV